MRFIKLSDVELETLREAHCYGKQFQFRNRCQCLILSHHGHSITRLAELFKVNRVTVYAWFDLWEAGGLAALHNKAGRGRRPKLSIANQKQVAAIEKAVSKERQNLKQVVAVLAQELQIKMHPDTLKRFLKNLTTLSAASANVSKLNKTRSELPKGQQI